MPEQITEPTEVEPVAVEATPVTQHPDPAADPAALVEADLLVEDVSIDGMCGVY